MPLKEGFIIYSPQEKGCPHWIWSGGGSNEKMRPRALFLFSLRNTKRGRGNGIGLASVNHFGGVGGLGLFLNQPVPGLI